MNQVAETRQRPAPIVQFKRDLEVVQEFGMLDEKAKAKMKSAALTAVSKDPDLLRADRASFMSELRRCANYGVLPDGNEAVLQVYNTKVKDDSGKDHWIKKVTLLPMIRGIINRVQRSGKIRSFYAEVVYEGEDFRLDLSQGDRRPVHEYDPMRRGPDTDIIGAYSVAVYKDGTIDTEVMPRVEIMKVRNVAKTKNVWDNWFSEKAKVAVSKRHSKRLPLSSDDLEFITNRDETDFEQAAIRDVTPEQPRTLAQRLTQPDPEPEQPDTPETDDEPLTGEILDGTGKHWTELVNTDDAAPMDDGWDDGVAAFKAGKDRTECPEGDNAAAWLAGYDQQKQFQEEAE